MTTTASVLTVDEQASWIEQGFFIRRGFAGPEIGEAMLERVIDICRRAAAGEEVRPALVTPEMKPNPNATQPEDLVSKVFRLHRDTVFAAFAHSPEVGELVGSILGPDVDCFLSQFIFKTPGAYGQPWHQDSYYFPFEAPADAPPEAQRAVGVWLAVTEATLANGCLHVLPGSHHEPVHEHVPDSRPDSNQGYVEIVDHDMRDAVPVLMAPGDLLVFDSHLMHRSTDNETDGIRAAMVYHYGRAGTIDHTPRERTINKWIPVRRDGVSLPA